MVRRQELAVPLLLLASALAVGACGRTSDGDAGQTDSTLARDLTLAEQGTPPLMPADTALNGEVETPRVNRPAPAAVPAPARRTARAPERPQPPEAEPQRERPTSVTASAPAPVPAPVPSTGGSGSGAVAMTAEDRVCTTGRPGDKITATITSAPTSGPATAGATAVLEVASITPAADGRDARITFRIRGVVDDAGVVHPASGEVATTEPLEVVRPAGDPASEKKKVIGGAIAGAVLGQIMGKDTRATVIGAAAGAAAGTAAAMHDRPGAQACTRPGTVLRGTVVRG